MRPLHPSSEIVVIGAGVAGLTAARHAARLGHSVTVVEPAPLYGGQIATVGQVEGLPVPGAYSGQDLVTHLTTQCRSLGVQFAETEVANVQVGDRLHVLCSNGDEYTPRALIVASGARPRPLGVANELELAGRGVSKCATCDGPLFRNKDVVVVGGGDSAVQEAHVLARTCGMVTLVSRSPLRAKRHAIERLAAMETVRFIWDCEVDGIVGTDGVDGVRLRDRRNGAMHEISCMGVFPYIGSIPNSAFLPPRMLDAEGYVDCAPGEPASAENIFVAGAVRKGYGGDLAEAIGEGVAAAIAADRLFH